VAFGTQVRLEPLQPADNLSREPAYLGELPPDGCGLRSDALADGVADPSRERRLERRCCGRELFDLRPRPFERRLDVGRCGRRPGQPLLRLPEDVLVHAPDTTVEVGRMRISELDYELPAELIAQRPAERRDESRLLVYERATGAVRHRRFAELPEELATGEVVVVNDTRVVPARLRLRRPGGGQAEVLLVERMDEDGRWEGLARPSRRLRPGQRLGCVELLEPLGEGRWRLRLHGEPAGEMPLPPYITEPLREPGRYQTVYAREAGSAAAPTAGLHFTPELLARLDVERVTLHVGLDTFRPVTADRLEEHRLHGERYEVAPAAWERIGSADRVLAVGTTTVRVLESLAHGSPLSGRTELFVTPGFEFRRVDALLTNFHLPRSTLLALVMAFAGVDETRELYRLAVAERYRFYSFGDAMLVR
jgi:S-adenosylmethionine:tRNA ribosyltransferase-isomerase